jgi:hypothetical protein
MPATRPLDAVYRDRRPPDQAPGGAAAWQRFSVVCLAGCWLAYLAMASPVVWRALTTLPTLAADGSLPATGGGVTGFAARLGDAFGWLAYLLTTWLGLVVAGFSLVIVRLAELHEARIAFRLAAAAAVVSAALVGLPAAAVPRMLQLFALSLPLAYGVSGTWRAARVARRTSSSTWADV